VDADRQRELLRAHMALGQWGPVRRTAEKLLEGPWCVCACALMATATVVLTPTYAVHSPDDWEVLRAYLDAFFHMNEDMTARELACVCEMASCWDHKGTDARPRAP
jgi:hypothetical protein